MLLEVVLRLYGCRFIIVGFAIGVVYRHRVSSHAFMTNWLVEWCLLFCCARSSRNDVTRPLKTPKRASKWKPDRITIHVPRKMLQPTGPTFI